LALVKVFAPTLAPVDDGGIVGAMKTITLYAVVFAEGGRFSSATD